ncbi:hydrolase, TatD family [Capnocytophaga sp. oral taxon 332 str. F0381]|uniref:TatD family hydrolase n=1 Tax=Capnocytophaga sp. oral taxon 332 TaxID=712213 RepID=UPI0002A41A57|nr:TatD family hydrolase [Capnocytophaga sp. oral taxon 332]EKY12417.1 hydrolase, TatD family [Capnocytophaga sp. oral taxon 332 str. F0381]
MIDTHTHLYSEEFDKDRAEMIARAKAAGVTRCFIPAIDSSYTERMFQLKNEYPDYVFLMNGLHPCNVKENYKEELTHVENLMPTHSFCAIGEIGIDLYWDKTFLKEQQEAFAWQIQLAKKHQLPIVIHCREAFDEVFEVLESEKGDDLFGIFHCFSGTEAQAYRAIDYGLHLGIGGVVTFKNGNIDKFLRNIDLQHIVLETDSPYLAPIPYRGKRNESAYIVQVADKLSDIYELPVDEIKRITTENATKIFKI